MCGVGWKEPSVQITDFSTATLLQSTRIDGQMVKDGKGKTVPR